MYRSRYHYRPIRHICETPLLEVSALQKLSGKELFDYQAQLHREAFSVGRLPQTQKISVRLGELATARNQLSDELSHRAAQILTREGENYCISLP